MPLLLLQSLSLRSGSSPLAHSLRVGLLNGVGTNTEVLSLEAGSAHLALSLGQGLFTWGAPTCIPGANALAFIIATLGGKWVLPVALFHRLSLLT